MSASTRNRHRKRNRYRNINQPLNAVDKAVLEGETEGFARVHIKKGTDEILGATIVAAHAGDMISHLRWR